MVVVYWLVAVQFGSERWPLSAGLETLDWSNNSELESLVWGEEGRLC